MPLTTFQSDIFKIIGTNRSPSSYVAGGTAIHARPDGGRLSNDIDLFHDLDEALLISVTNDEASLKSAGYQIEFLLKQSAFQRALISKSGLSIKMEWARDSSFRFFPVVEDAEMGYRLHDADLCTNKVLACAGRSESRDFFDILHFDKTYLPLGAIVWAACGKDEGFTPDLILDQISRNSKFRAQDFEKLQAAGPIDIKSLKLQWLDCFQRAASFISRMPPETIGSLFLLQGKPVAPTNTNLSELQIHRGSICGAWPRLI